MLTGWGSLPPPGLGRRRPASLRPLERPGLQGHESAGSCPGLTPNNGGESHFSARGEAALGTGVGGRPLGKPVGLELPISACSLPSPAPAPPSGPLWQDSHPQLRAQLHPCTQESCPTRGYMGLTLAPAICMASPLPQQLNQLSPPPKGPSLGGRKKENPPPKKNPPPTHEYIKLCSLTPTPPFRSPWQLGSIPSPSLNPSPSSAKGGLRPLPTHFSQHSTGTSGEEESRASVLSPLLLSVGGPRGFLGLRGLPTRVEVRVGMGMGAGLGAWTVLALHIDTQPLVTRLLATRLAAAVQYLLHQLVHSGHLLVAGALERHLGRAAERFPRARGGRHTSSWPQESWRLGL